MCFGLRAFHSLIPLCSSLKMEKQILELGSSLYDEWRAPSILDEGNYEARVKVFATVELETKSKKIQKRER